MPEEIAAVCERTISQLSLVQLAVSLDSTIPEEDKTRAGYYLREFQNSKLYGEIRDFLGRYAHKFR